MNLQKHNMISGRLYNPSEPELAEDRLRCQVLVEQFNATSAADVGLRQKLLHDLFGHVGTGSALLPPLACDYGYQVRIGDRTFINYGAVFLDAAGVTIGDDVQIGPYVQFLTSTHPLDASTRRTGQESAEPIHVGFSAWLGGGVILCPGVTVGDETVVGAGAVVTHDLPPRVLAAGNPARVIREL